MVNMLMSYKNSGKLFRLNISGIKAAFNGAAVYAAVNKNSAAACAYV